jgi:hypothetical protein
VTDANGSGRRRTIALSAVAVLVAGVCIGGIAVARDGGGSDEFVVAEPDSGYSLTLPKSDRTFTLSSLFIRRPAAEIRVLEVRALTSPNVEYIGAVNVWPSDFREVPLSIGPGFPAPEIKAHHPLSEAVPATATSITPRPGITSVPPLAVAAGFRVVSGDLGAVNGVRVIYTVNGERVTEDFRQSVIVCVKPRSCDTPDGQDPGDRHDAILSQFGLLPKNS